jgi:flagellar hook-basal body complex protein FliE
MSMNISGLIPPIPIPAELAAPELAAPSSPASNITAGGEGPSFTNVLSSAINEVESSRSSAAASVDQFLSGEGGDLHSTILASQRADLEFQMFMQVRNKIVSAYQEVMKMQL